MTTMEGVTCFGRGCELIFKHPNVLSEHFQNQTVLTTINHINSTWKTKCPIFKAIVDGFRGKVAR